MKNTLQSLGFVMLWIVGLAATAFIVLALIYGAEWLSVAVYPLIVPTLFWTLAVCVVVLLPAALIRPLRAFASLGLLVASWVFGFITWIFSFIVTLAIWGVWGVLIGLLFMGVGITPVAFAAMLLHSDWHPRIWDLLLMVVLTFGVRALALWLAEKADKHTDYTSLDFPLGSSTDEDAHGAVITMVDRAEDMNADIPEFRHIEHSQQPTNREALADSTRDEKE